MQQFKSVVGEETNIKQFSELLFRPLLIVTLKNFYTWKRKHANMMNNYDFQTIIREYKFEELFNPN